MHLIMALLLQASYPGPAGGGMLGVREADLLPARSAVVGVGLDNFLYEYPKYILPNAWQEPNLSHPHNFLLDFWTRLGVVGVVILFGMLVTFYRRAWHAFTMTNDLYTRALMLGLMASMVDFLAHGLIDAAYFYVDLAYVFMLTLALAQVFQTPSVSDTARDSMGSTAEKHLGS